MSTLQNPREKRQNPLSKFEAFMQRIVEGPFAFLFPSKLQPAEVARKLERALEDNSLLQGEGKRMAPDIYEVNLSFKDRQQLAPVEKDLKKDWEKHLIQFARQHHYTLRADPVVNLHAQSKLRSGAVRVEARMRGGNDGSDMAMATQAISAEQLQELRNASLIPPQASGFNQPATPQHQSGQALTQYSAPPSGQQQPLPPATQQAPVQPMPHATLTIRTPQQPHKVFYIEKVVIKIGRQLDNDIIVEDRRVSRYHAQIKYQDGQFTIFDLGTTSGLNVNGVPNLRQHLLRSGDRFIIGSYEFYYERR